MKLFRHTEEGFSAYSSPVMLIFSRKMTQDKRVVLDFRHLNMHIAKEQLGLPTFERYLFSARKF